MEMNTKETFNLEGSKIISLHSEIKKVQSVWAAAANVKVMFADTTDALELAVNTINASEDREIALAESYQVEGYRITLDQIPPRATVEQIRAIRSFIKV